MTSRLKRVKLRHRKLKEMKVQMQRPMKDQKRSKLKRRRKRSSRMLNRQLSTFPSRQTQMHTFSQLTVTVSNHLTHALVENYSETYWMDYDIRMR